MLNLSSTPSFSQAVPASNAVKSAISVAPAAKTAPVPLKKAKKKEIRMKPFSRLAVGGGISPMGVNLQAATNLNRRMNLRATGNVFNYTLSDIKINDSNGTNGFDLNGKVNMATAGVSLDFYPFPTHGLRVSPGFMLYNQNNISASATPSAGTSFTLNDVSYYSDAVDPITMTANLGLNARQQAFTLTTGWGNMIPRKGGHWSFPFEIGAVFTGVPTLNVVLTGKACTNNVDAVQNGFSCVDMATNATAQSNLSAQIAKYKSDLNPLQVFPIVSFGASYNFRIR
jgi:hypothetical protein